jgi:hypothetical protein
MPRQPRGKRSTTSDGDVEVVAKNSNGDGSVYFEPASKRSNGSTRPGYWRASYRDAAGKRRTVSGPTRVQAEARREVKLAEIAAIPAVGSRFTRHTTVAELTDWWLDSVARHQVKTSTLDSYRKFASCLADDIGAHAVVDVGPELLAQWQSKLRSARPGVGRPRPRGGHCADPTWCVVYVVGRHGSRLDKDIRCRRRPPPCARLGRSPARSTR